MTPTRWHRCCGSMDPRRSPNRSKVLIPLAHARMPKSDPLVRKKLWIFDFDNTLARLEPEVDWAGGRRELEPMLRGLGVPEDLFEKIPRGNLPLYSATRARLLELVGDRSSGLNAARMRSILRRASNMIEKYEIAGVDRA